MLFPTFEFFLFFTIVLIFNWFLKRWPLVWRLFLLFSSYFFYSVWDWRFPVVLLLVSVFNFLSAQIIFKNIFGKRKASFILAVIYNLFFLGVFKYYDFFRTSAELLFEKIGLPVTFPLLEIILPIGLSFYIFRTISYNADVYLGKITPTSSLLDFLIYVAFFPQLLSGPIMRAGDFLSQLKEGGAKRIEKLYRHLSLILLGLFKKLVISSYLTLALTDDVFAVPENHSFVIILLAVFAYSLVIYFDFSGYSDMAIGFAGLMGFESPVNFDTPYLVTNLRDFWRRWHISLSSWVRDYVYIPLGGNRRGKIRKYFNLMVAMFLIGLWHGAAPHFIIWGVIHGMVLVGTHYSRDRKDFNSSSKLDAGLLKKLGREINKFFCWFATFIFVSFSWIFFRSDSVGNAFKFIRTFFNPGRLTEPFKIYILFLIIVGFLLFLFEKQVVRGLVAIQRNSPLIFWFLFVIFAIILIFKLSPDIIPSFIYFGF